MDEPPILLDGARALEYAILDAGTRGVVGGVPLGFDAVSRLVIAENLVEAGVFLIHCNDEWSTVIGESYADAQSARIAAGESYRGRIGWIRYRDLTAQEAREVETTRAFLREITAEYPPG
jgi:hypothetical protein